jgi:basic membrane protein A
MGEGLAARALIAAGCDVIAQHVDTVNPQIEAERAGVWGIGYNTDMSVDVPAVVLTSVLWNWGAYYTYLVQSVIDGTFTTRPYYGSLKDGIVSITALSDTISWESSDRFLELRNILEDERQRIESEVFKVFEGIMETNDGRFIGEEGRQLSDREIQFGIDWHYCTVIEL